MNLIPKVKQLEVQQGYLKNKELQVNSGNLDSRLLMALQCFSLDEKGVPLEFDIEKDGEGYELTISENNIQIKAEGPAGAFYAIQTLRQIFKEDRVPCLHIKDQPDFKYRGFYHDVTRGKIPTVETIKKLIDAMAYYKLNSLQLYVEHVFEFEESKELWEQTGYLSKKEMKEIEAYCNERFIEFIPSLSTFGHMYDLLSQDKYKHLRVFKDFEEPSNIWKGRMRHHTIDPLHPESIELVKSLLNQYIPVFESDVFNICCDETFDLKKYAEEGLDVGSIYLDFTKQIISHVHSHDKKVWMWGDILLEHPEIITEFSEDVVFLNWYYNGNLEKMEQKISQFAGLNRKQIVCPGTSTWNRFCECVGLEEINIGKMAEIGYQYGAEGVLNTNWGDWGNIASLELAMYGLVLGAEKSWSVHTEINDEFYSAVNALLYGCESGRELLGKVSHLNERVSWFNFVFNYVKHRYDNEELLRILDLDKIEQIQNEYAELAKELKSQSWEADEYLQEMLLAVEGSCLIAELTGHMLGIEVHRITNTMDWLQRYKEMWRKKNKESELFRIEEIFVYYEEISKAFSAQ